MSKRSIIRFGIAISAISFLVITGTASADHAWGSYHWKRSANPFILPIIDSVTSSWDSILNTTLSDWSISNVLDLVKENGSTETKERRSCRPVTGKVRACNYTYGRNGWLGMAQIWISGDHITQATTKVNDSYFNYAPYNTIAWKNLVMCQEVGHDFGLDHQDENFSNPNLGTCMDYTSDPSTNQYPNLHDYSMLETIYAHLDTTEGGTSSTIPPFRQSEDFDSNNPQEWGRQVRESARASVYERDLGEGRRILTHVFWSEDKINRVR